MWGQKLKCQLLAIRLDNVQTRPPRQKIIRYFRCCCFAHSFIQLPIIRYFYPSQVLCIPCTCLSSLSSLLSNGQISLWTSVRLHALAAVRLTTLVKHSAQVWPPSPLTRGDFCVFIFIFKKWCPLHKVNVSQPLEEWKEYLIRNPERSQIETRSGFQLWAKSNISQNV